MLTKDLTRAERRDLKKLQRTECWKKMQARAARSEENRIRLKKKLASTTLELESTAEKLKETKEELKLAQKELELLNKVQKVKDLFVEDTAGKTPDPKTFTLIPTSELKELQK